MKKLRFSLCIVIYIIMVYLISGCSAKSFDYDGKNLVDTAAALHTGLESADITVTDNLSGGTVQSITYRFVTDVMQYMYFGSDGEKKYYEFNNGTELDMITLPDESGWSFAAKGSEGFYQYSRTSRHYFADGAQLFNDYEAAVSSTEIMENGAGKKLVINYDLSKLSQYQSLAAYGEFTEFGMEFVFDGLGYCTSFRNYYALADGAKHDYTIEIAKRDSLLPVERTKVI